VAAWTIGPGCDEASYAALGVGTDPALLWPRTATALARVGADGELVPGSQVARLAVLDTRRSAEVISGGKLYTRVTLRRRSPGR
jgi:hypothetical protein